MIVYERSRTGQPVVRHVRYSTSSAHVSSLSHAIDTMTKQ